jgi:hypothetical protein
VTRNRALVFIGSSVGLAFRAMATADHRAASKSQRVNYSFRTVKRRPCARSAKRLRKTKALARATRRCTATPLIMRGPKNGQDRRQSRTQRPPQFQPRRLLQCHPGPQPSAIRSTRRATPISNKLGLARIGAAHANTVTKATKTTIIAAIMRIPTPIRDVDGTVVEEQLTEPKAGRPR